MGYSIIGSGNISAVIDSDDRLHGLNALMWHYGGEGKAFDEHALSLTTVLKLDVKEYSGKHHVKRG